MNNYETELTNCKKILKEYLLEKDKYIRSVKFCEGYFYYTINSKPFDINYIITGNEGDIIYFRIALPVGIILTIANFYKIYIKGETK